MLILSETDLMDLLSPQRIVAAVEAALRDHAAEAILSPPRMHVDLRGNTLLVMPAVGRHTFGVKIVSVIPGNARTGLPVTSANMIVNDATTGRTLAMMSAAALTAQRTGAVGGLGVKYGTPEDTQSVGIVGCGTQGAWQAVFACALRPIRDVFCVSRSEARFERFATTVQDHVPGVRITQCANVEALLQRTDLVITATTSAVPVLPDDPALLAGKHFISVGSFRPTMQELPDAVFRLAGALAVDSEHARHEVGDVINALRLGLLQETDIFNIALCVTGKRTFDPARTTAYKTVGAALYDLYVAQAFYEAAKASGRGIEIAL